MVNVPLPVGYVGIDDLPKQREMLINCINLDGSIVRTPGITTLIAPSAVSGGGASAFSLDPTDSSDTAAAWNDDLGVTIGEEGGPILDLGFVRVFGTWGRWIVGLEPNINMKYAVDFYVRHDGGTTHIVYGGSTSAIALSEFHDDYPDGIIELPPSSFYQFYLIDTPLDDNYGSHSFIMAGSSEELSTAMAIQPGCRGATTWALDGNAYFVIGNQLVRVESDESVTILGAIAGSADCDLVGGQVQLVIMVRGGSSYTYSPSGGLAQITDPNFVPCVSVDYIDGRHVFIPLDGSPAIYSEVDDAGTFTALSFFDAEESPDVNRFIINVQNQIFVMGEESTEMFVTTGEADAPFSRSSGQRIDYGYAAGGVRYNNTFCFIGRQRGQSYAFYIKVTGDAQEISNAVVNEDLNAYTKDQIEDVRVNRFKWYGKEFLAWSFHDKTYVFCEGNWFFMDSDLNGTEAGPWRVNGVAFANGKYYVGDRSTGAIGVLSESPSEYGAQVEYQFDTYVRAQRGQYMTPSSLEADVLTGQNATTIGLSLSRDGRIKGDYHYRSLGSTGHYQRRIRWCPSGGLGRYESYMGISIRGTGSVQFSAEGLYVN